MKPNRRGFLRILGVSPIAAKAATESSLLQAAGGENRLSSAQFITKLPPVFNPANMDAHQQAEESGLIAAGDYVKAFGVPGFVEDSLRMKASYVSCLDADLIAKKSWSLSVKLVTQRERNYQKLVDCLQKDADRGRAHAAFRGLVGWCWPNLWKSW